ncbi:unnamed protein product, partial [Urochloa humidicola]
ANWPSDRGRARARQAAGGPRALGLGGQATGGWAHGDTEQRCRHSLQARAMVCLWASDADLDSA